MFLIIVLLLAIISGCITAANYEDGRVRTTGAWAVLTSILFTIYMTGIQS